MSDPQNRKLSWREKLWWRVESGFPAASASEQTFAAFIDGARTNRQRVGIRKEILRDVIPFYFLGKRDDFIDVRSKMWLAHINTYSKIKNRHDGKPGTTEIDYTAGHLDIIDRKFGVLLTIQGLIGTVISITIGAFKDKLLPLLRQAPKDKLVYTVIALFLIFVIFTWAGLALSRMWKVFIAGVVLAAGLAFCIGFLGLQMPDYVAGGFIIALIWLWFTTTLMCLRGTGRARWGEMKPLENETDLVELKDGNKVDNEYNSQLMGLIRSLVGRTAIYRATVLLVFTNLYCLVLTASMTGLVLTDGKAPKQQKTPERQDEMHYEVSFAPGDTCETSPTALSDIGKIAAEVHKRNPIGLLVVGSADAMPVRRDFREAVGNNATLAMSRAECVSGRIVKLLHLNKNNNLPIEVTTRGPYDRSPHARSKGSALDRVVEVHLVKPII